MGWLIKSDPPHFCYAPRRDGQIGDIWQCSECERIWVIAHLNPHFWREAEERDLQRLRETEDA